MYISIYLVNFARFIKDSELIISNQIYIIYVLRFDKNAWKYKSFEEKNLIKFKKEEFQ